MKQKFPKAALSKQTFTTLAIIKFRSLSSFKWYLILHYSECKTIKLYIAFGYILVTFVQSSTPPHPPGRLASDIRLPRLHLWPVAHKSSPWSSDMWHLVISPEPTHSGGQHDKRKFLACQKCILIVEFRFDYPNSFRPVGVPKIIS